MNNRYFILLVVMLIATPTLFANEKTPPLNDSFKTCSNTSKIQMSKEKDDFVIDYHKKRRNALVVGFVGVGCMGIALLDVILFPVFIFKFWLAMYIISGIYLTFVFIGVPMMIVGFAYARYCKKKMHSYLPRYNEDGIDVSFGYRFKT